MKTNLTSCTTQTENTHFLFFFVLCSRRDFQAGTQSGEWLLEPTGLPCPALSEVPDCLWPVSGHSVRLNGDCGRVHIAPGSYYLPYRKRYALNPGAIEGILPVLGSFLESNIVVPCENSPVYLIDIPGEKGPSKLPSLHVLLMSLALT